MRDAIAALSKTTGGSNLFARTTGRQPLLEALSYPDRRVQYEAALTLGNAMPQQRFAGDQAVVPTLASAVRQGGKAMAVVELPKVDPFVAPILYTIPVQLLAYHAAVAKGTDVDQPRNLAKSVTVE